MKCVIFVFSGTGNTAFVADRIGERFKEKDIETNIYNIDEMNNIPDISDCEYIGLGYPVHAFGAPMNVLAFAGDLPESTGDQKGFVFATYGGSGLYAVREGVNILEKKKFRMLRSRGFKMPDNVTVSRISKLQKLTPEKKEKQFNDAAEAVPGYVDEILEGRTDIEHYGWIFGWIFSLFLRFFFRKFGAADIGKKFRINDNCTSCKLCARSCPVQNIKMVDGKPQFLDHCIACCRCYNLCPAKAIDHPGAPDKDFRYKADGYKPPIVNDV